MTKLLYRCRDRHSEIKNCFIQLVYSFSQNHFFGEFGTDFSDCRRASELLFFLNKRRKLCLEMYIPFFRNSILFGFPRHSTARTRNLALFDISAIQLSRQKKSNFHKTLCTFLDIGLFFYLKKNSSLALIQSEKSVSNSQKN